MKTSETRKSLEPTPLAFEKLFVNNGALSEIEAYIQRFNPIKVMKMEHMEIRHSAILAWLFDPKESHGLEDKFLKAFLSEAIRGRDEKGNITALDVARADLRGATIRTEWQHIDLFVSCDFTPLKKPTTWAFVIENKFHSKQYKGQLQNYREKIEAIFDADDREIDIKINGIYLTLHEDPPEDTSFVSLKYHDVVSLLENTIQQNSHCLTPEVSVFLTHYINILNEATGMSKTQTKMEKLARELYLEHKKVIDFVVEHGASTDFAFAARALFNDPTEGLELKTIGERDFYYNDMSNSIISFLPESWADAFDGESEEGFEWPGCEDWWAEYPMIAWLEIKQDSGKNADGKKGQLRLNAEVGRLAEWSARKDAIERVKAAAIANKMSKTIKFQSGAENEGKKYSKFLKQNSLVVKDVHDSEEIEKAMRTLLKKFQPEFDAIGEALKGFHKYGKGA